MEAFLELIIIFIGLHVFLLVAGIVVLVRTRKTKKHMQALGVDDTARKRFERETRVENTRRIGNLTITDNWVCNKTVFVTVLYPLQAIEFFEKGYDSGRYGTSFHVKLLFKDGGKYTLPCSFEQQDEMMAVLEERCPQANQRDFGTYV